MRSYNFRIIIRQDEDGIFIADCPALPGCHTQGKSYEQVVDRMEEAISLYLEVLRKRHLIKQLTQRMEPQFFALKDIAVTI